MGKIQLRILAVFMLLSVASVSFAVRAGHGGGSKSFGKSRHFNWGYRVKGGTIYNNPDYYNFDKKYGSGWYGGGYNRYGSNYSNNFGQNMYGSGKSAYPNPYKSYFNAYSQYLSSYNSYYNTFYSPSYGSGGYGGYNNFSMKVGYPYYW